MGRQGLWKCPNCGKHQIWKVRSASTSKLEELHELWGEGKGDTRQVPPAKAGGAPLISGKGRSSLIMMP